MFDVMIIDDEVSIIESLKTSIAWDKLPIRFSCEASDGETAKDLYQLYHPKIIITDINIPVLSGLDLIEELKKEDPELLFIVITGYTDFELARRTLNLDAFKLISKPIAPAVINRILTEAVRHLESKREERKKIDSLQDLLANNMPQIREAFLANLLQHQPKAPALIPVKLAQLGIDCPGPEYLAAVVMAQMPSEGNENIEGISLLLLDSIRKKLAEIGAVVSGYVDSEFRANCIISIPVSCSDGSIEGALIRLGEQMQSVQNVRILTGIGMRVPTLSDVHQSYQAALTALDNKNVLGSESVVFYNDLKRVDAAITLPEQLIPYLLSNFREGNLQAVEVAFRSHIQSLQKNDVAIRSFCFEYITCISNEAIHAGLSLEQINGYVTLITGLFQMNNVESFVEDILSTTERLLDEMVSKREANSNYLISLSKEYIRNNLDDKELDLDKICNHMGLSRYYFSRLFHQTQNVGFSAYLKAERIKKAKKLLRTTNMRIFEISDACGFSNAKYFSYVFKQVVGEKPLDYQKKLL